MRENAIGYYTKYDLEHVKGADRDAVLSAIIDASGYHYPFEDTCKWYGYEDDMRKVSLMFPGAEIMISGNGEEAPDFWRAWFKDGKMKYSKGVITYAEPSEYK